MALPRAKTFRAWMEAHFTRRQLAELVDRSHFTTGEPFPRLPAEVWDLFEAYGDELWSICAAAAEAAESANTLAYLGELQRDPERDDLASMVTLLVHAAAEEVAVAIVGVPEEDDRPSRLNPSQADHPFQSARTQDKILASDDLEWVREWLLWNDPNGSWTERARRADYLDPLTLDVAKAEMRRMLEDAR